MNEPQTLLSGISPSGRLTLGNYLGAIRNWVAHQDQYECFFPLVDLHAITVRQDSATFADRCRDFVALYIACGVSPDDGVVFIQSHVSEHCELAWILQCYTQVGELNRMTQFKDKSRQNTVNANAGLFVYPTLMAADILLYKANFVPVGDDQRQHLELTRDVAGRFNGVHGSLFPLPEAYVSEAGARIMSLQDPTKKVSKSDASDANILALLDPSDVIARKIRRCVTDSGSEIAVRDDKPGVTNLLHILSATTDVPIARLEDQYRGSGYGQLKKDVGDAVVAIVEPIRNQFSTIRADAAELDRILIAGATRAKEVAGSTLAEVHAAIGFIPRS